MENRFDMIIIGGGPGGYSAALYAARSGLKTLVLEKFSAGGQLGQTHWIDNYPGFPEGIDGFTLAQQMQSQAHRFGAETRYEQVIRLELQAQPKRVHTAKQTYLAKTVVFATGANARPLGLAGEEALIGRGVGYCAACDGMFYKGKTVVVVGGGNTAASDALLLSRVAEKVILVHRRDTLRATKVYHSPLLNAPNVQFRWDSEVVALQGQERLTGVTVKNLKTGGIEEISCQGLFVSIGRLPNSALAEGQLTLDDGGYIQTDGTPQTEIAGVYAVGDVRNTPLRQVVTAVADGALAVHQAEFYLSQQES
ncbi:MAG: thioredoxin-disulfide reductase [Oscillospiraceae bacterium]|nr:thioredoxin-disulfide reductase [Oscillospiraceae bacterium]